MKKYIVLMIILFNTIFTMNASAQIQYYRTTAYAQASVYNGRYYWGNWEKSDMVITLNLTTDVITVYSPRIQVYRVYETGQTYRDSDGGTQIQFYVIDQDGDKGTIRLRIQADGTSQIYIDFSNIAWCYNVIRTA